MAGVELVESRRRNAHAICEYFDFLQADGLFVELIDRQFDDGSVLPARSKVGVEPGLGEVAIDHAGWHRERIVGTTVGLGEVDYRGVINVHGHDPIATPRVLVCAIVGRYQNPPGLLRRQARNLRVGDRGQLSDYELDAIQALIDAEPDVVLIPGDFYQFPSSQFDKKAPEFREAPRKLTDAIPMVLLVNGNTDTVDGLRQIVAGNPARFTRGDTDTSIILAHQPDEIYRRNADLRFDVSRCRTGSRSADAAGCTAIGRNTDIRELRQPLLEPLPTCPW